VQDDYVNPVEPTDSMLFTLRGITDFLVQGFDGTNWVTLSTVTGNNLVKRRVAFAPFATNRIRIYVTGALASWSRSPRSRRGETEHRHRGANPIGELTGEPNAKRSYRCRRAESSMHPFKATKPTLRWALLL
jgi:hypothetical protein